VEHKLQSLSDWDEAKSTAAGIPLFGLFDGRIIHPLLPAVNAYIIFSSRFGTLTSVMGLEAGKGGLSGST
jgi:hypothetical protein